MENFTENWLLKKLEQHQGKTALVWRDQLITYDRLVAMCKQWLFVIKESNIVPGVVVSFCGDYSPNVCALFIALIINKNILVPIASTTKSNHKKFLKLANVKFNFAFDNDDNYFLTELKHEPDCSYYLELQQKNASGIVLFSSGSTGESKGIVLNADLLLEKFKNTSLALTTIAFLLLDHIGGINTMFYILANGGTLISTSNKSPGNICELIQRFRVELLPTTPTFINVLLSSGLHEEYDLSSLKIITYGTEPMGQHLLRYLHECLPNAKLKQTYGLSEVGILPTKSLSNDSLWFRIREDVPYKIQDGILYLKIKTAMLGYLNAASPIDQDGWFNTGDSVVTSEVNGEQYLKVLGRKSDIINVGGEKVYPAEIENVILQLSFVTDVVVYSKANPVIGYIVVAKVNLSNAELSDVSKLIRDFCKSRLEAYKVPQLIEITNEQLYGARFKKQRSKISTETVKEKIL